MSDFIELDDVPCRLGKFSNNLVMEAAEEGEDEEAEEVGVFTFPVTEIMLGAEELNALFGDAHTHASWFNDRRGMLEPMPWIACLPEPAKGKPPGFDFAQKFEGAVISIAYAENPTEKTQRDEFEGCKIGRIALMPRPGGLTEMKLHVQLKPGLGKENLRLQEYQNRRIAFSISDAAIARKKSQQQNLPLEDGGSTPGYTNHGTTTNGNGETRELRSGAEIDAEMHARSPNGETMGADAHPIGGIGPKTRAEIEKAAKRRGARGSAAH